MLDRCSSFRSSWSVKVLVMMVTLARLDKVRLEMEEGREEGDNLRSSLSSPWQDTSLSSH